MESILRWVKSNSPLSFSVGWFPYFITPSSFECDEIAISNWSLWFFFQINFKVHPTNNIDIKVKFFLSMLPTPTNSLLYWHRHSLNKTPKPFNVAQSKHHVLSSFSGKAYFVLFFHFSQWMNDTFALATFRLRMFEKDEIKCCIAPSFDTSVQFTLDVRTCTSRGSSFLSSFSISHWKRNHVELWNQQNL